MTAQKLDWKILTFHSVCDTLNLSVPYRSIKILFSEVLTWDIAS